MRRRTFLGGLAVAAATPAGALAARQPRGEVPILQAALELEQLGVYVYDAGIKSGLLDEALVEEIGALRDHEQQHADAVASLLEALGGSKPGPPRTPQEADARLERAGATGRLASVTDRESFLALAHELETVQVAGYVAAVGGLGDVRLIQTAASILAAQGAHLVVLRGHLRRERVPSPLEGGA